MITYIIKSTISMLVLYGFYHLSLRQHKILIFNRIYLITSLLFSLIIPLIVIPVKTDFSISTGINSISTATSQIIQSNEIIAPSAPHFTFESIVVIVFLLISSVLLFRFALNIYSLFTKIRKGKKIVKQNTTHVLIDENIIPYSFFGYIFLNRQSFEDGKIEKELIMHEEAHCNQVHSIDIIILEVINIFFWFNPAIWLFRKAIQLNHEYYADNKVLTNSDPEDYLRLLISLVVQNNTSYLVSNFKYSQIKNRLVMMSKISPTNYSILRKIGGIALFLFLGMAMSLSKEKILNINIPDFKIEVLTPIAGVEKPELWPVKPETGTTEYHSTSRTFGEKYTNTITKKQTVHYGIDLQVPFGTDVMATAGGKVIKAIYDGGYGNTIVVDHGEGYQSMYAHLKDFTVKKGDTVTKGQTIGHVGSSGLSTGPHLHFEILLYGERLNPLNYLK